VGKNQTSAQTKVIPYFRVREFKYAGIFFGFDKKIFKNFACRDSENFFCVAGGGNDNFFLKKPHMFWGHAPVKKGGESIF
jgi:hypothetical protein